MVLESSHQPSAVYIIGSHAEFRLHRAVVGQTFCQYCSHKVLRVVVIGELVFVVFHSILCCVTYVLDCRMLKVTY